MRRYNWLLDELAQAGRENLDVDHASQYDVKEDASAVEELALMKKLGLNDQSEVVDIGAGTGQFTLAVASACARVVAVDVSSVMLAAIEIEHRMAHSVPGAHGSWNISFIVFLVFIF